MRIQVIYKAEKIPSIHIHRFSALIKSAILKENKDYYNKLYSQSDMKPYSFTTKFDCSDSRIANLRLTDEYNEPNVIYHLTKNNEISFFISSPDELFMMSLIQGLRKLKQFNLSAKNTLSINNQPVFIYLKKIISLDQPKIDSNKIIIRSDSPILVEDKYGNPILFNNVSEFNDCLEYHTSIRFQSLFQRPLKQRLKIKYIESKKQVIKHFVSGFASINKQNPIMYLTGSKGKFELEGSIEDLILISQIGLGLRTGQGFGMISVIK